MTRTVDSFNRATVDRALEWLGVQLGDREPTDAQIVDACLEIEAIDAAADAAQARAELVGQVARRW